MASKTAPKSKVRDAAFAKRLNEACDNHPQCPPLHYGRLSWIVQQFKEQFKIGITTETARKWVAGEVHPRRKSMALLAQLLQVDLAWLAIGVEGETTADERKARNVMAGAAINLVAGLIEMDGGHPAYPEQGDAKAKDVDIFAIIRGAQYAFKVAVGHQDGKSYSFAIPANYRDVFVIGLIRIGAFQFDVLELDAETITKNKENKGSHVSLTVDKRGAHYVVGGRRLKQLSGFAERP